MTPAAHAAGLFHLDDGIEGTDGHLDVNVDDYGSYGRAFPQNVFDWFQPVATQPTYPSYLAGVFVFVTTGTQVSSVLLSEYDVWTAFLEAPPPKEDGLFTPAVGGHTNLARTITQSITGSGAHATSAFTVTATEFALEFALDQTITTDVPTASSELAQVYTIHNAGASSVDLVFHAAWEPDLYFSTGSTNSYENDVVGIGPGLCAPYVHNPGSTTQAVAMTSGASTTLATPPYYYGGKYGEMPGTGDPFRDLSAADGEQYVWLRHGMPVNWRNFVVGANYNAPGDSADLQADATIGLEWRFTLAAGATETIDLRRLYGKIAVPCNVIASCGNGVVDSGELCDGANTATCNGGTCAASVCGDAYTNDAAGEECDTIGVDSDTCNGSLCTRPSCGDGYMNAAAGELCDEGGETAACTAACQPSSCGDGYVNAAAGEECDGGELCDSCRLTFSVGGGCAGCGASGRARSSLWLVALVWLSVRRRRRARTA